MKAASIAVPAATILALSLILIRPSCGDDQDDFEAVRTAVKNGLHQLASEQAVAFLRTHADSDRTTEVWLLLGIARFHTRDFNGSLQALAQAGKAGDTSPLMEDVLYWEGESLLEQNRPADALVRLTKLLDKHPHTRHRDDASYARAWAQAKTGKKKQAVSELRALLKKNPLFHNAELASFKIGKWLYDLNLYEEAARELDALPKIYPTSDYTADALYWAAESWFELKRWDKARNDYRKAMAATSDSLLKAYSKYGLAWVLAEEGNTEKAIELLSELRADKVPQELLNSTDFRLAGILFSMKRFEKASLLYAPLTKDPRYAPRARFSLGECTYHLGRYAAAIEHYKAVPPRDAEHYLDTLSRLGWCYLKIGDLPNAKKSFQNILSSAALPSVKARARSRLADVLFNEKQYDNASRQYETALQNEPTAQDRQHILYWLGLSHQRQGHHDKAIEMYKSLADQSPSDSFSVKGLDKLAQAYFLIEHYADAASAYHRLLIDPTADEKTRQLALYQIAECYFNEGKYKQALLQFDKVLTTLPGTALAKRALYGKAMCLQGSGNLKKANEQLRSFVIRHTTDELAPKAALLLANNQYQLSLFERAAETYASLTSAYPDAPENEQAQYWLGWCYYNLGNMPRAAEVWQRAASRRTDSHYHNDMLLAAADALLKQGDASGARTILKSFLSQTAPPASRQRAQVGYGDMLQTQSRYKDAVEHYRAAANGPDPSVAIKALFGIAESFYHRRDYSSAL